MNCTHFGEGVESLLDGLLPPDTSQALRAHAASCAACGEELRCAERFRALLAADGRAAIVSAADRETAFLARTETDDAPRGTVRSIWFRAAAAAVVVAAFGAGVVATRGTAPATDSFVTGSVELARGERRAVGAGRTFVSDDDGTALEVLDASHVRLISGSAMFQVEHGTPFEVATEQGTVEVRGTLFHVARRANRSVTVGVSSGVVAFHPAAGGAVRTLTAGAVLEVSATGVQTLVSRDQLAAAEAQAAAEREELATLRGAVAAKDDEIAALQSQLAAAQAAAPAPEDPARMWHALGEATRNLLFDPSVERGDRMAAIETFQKHAQVLRELTNGASALEWPWHPAVIAKTAQGFVDALAPLVNENDRTRAAGKVQEAATSTARAIAASTTQAEVTTARLALFRSITIALRDDLGTASAATVARSSLAMSEFVGVHAWEDGEAVRKQFVDIWLHRLELSDDQAGALAEPLDRWISATKAEQGSVLAAWGEEEGRAFLFPDPQAMWKPNPVPSDDDQIVATALRRLGAKIRLLAPRIEFERNLFSRVAPEVADRARREIAGEMRPTISTFR